MTDLQIYEEAHGPCINCGKESEPSKYWMSMSDEYWDMLRPSLINNVYFVPPLTKPFCGYKCANEYNEEKTNG